MLTALGASEVLSPEELLPSAEGKPRPLGKQRFHYVLDTVGGSVTAGLIPQIYYGGSISLYGNAGGIALETTVLPMILRGVNILGIDSVNFPIEKRAAIWERFTHEWHMMAHLPVSEVGPGELPGVFTSL